MVLLSDNNEFLTICPNIKAYNLGSLRIYKRIIA